jgi:hypothetical protein
MKCSYRVLKPAQNPCSYRGNSKCLIPFADFQKDGRVVRGDRNKATTSRTLAQVCVLYHTCWSCAWHCGPFATWGYAPGHPHLSMFLSLSVLGWLPQVHAKQVSVRHILSVICKRLAPCKLGRVMAIGLWHPTVFCALYVWHWSALCLFLTHVSITWVRTWVWGLCFF